MEGDCLKELGIVIPTLNAADTLRTTLESVREAISCGARAIVVDGGSRDTTLEVTDSLGIPLITKPGTMYAAINAGVAALGTPWLTWINADDILYSDAIACRLRYAETADVVYGTVDFIDREGRFVHCWQSARARSLRRLFRAGYSPLLQQGTVFHRRVFDRVGGFDESLRFVGDADFWWRALEGGHRFVRHPYPPAAAFRLHENQMSRNHAAAMRAEYARIASGRPKTSRVSALMALSIYRLENLRSYVIRLLRRPLLDGRLFPAGSYDSPTN
jgi:glycosyltransferase involved in cell wall biosynthesis